MSKFGIIGAGSFGTALAKLASENNHDVTLWMREQELCEKISKTRENSWFLPEIKLPKNISFTNDLSLAIKDKDIILSVCPSFAVRDIFNKIKNNISKKAIIVSATKGFDLTSKKLISEVFTDVLGKELANSMVIISGPNFAKEIALKYPTATLSVSKNKENAKLIQESLSNDYLRVYTSDDIIGAQLAASVKNVIAIAAGILVGLGFAYNTLASMITRATVEIARLGISMGGQKETFAGLAGIGDLMLTCLGDLSRNRQVGIKIGQGKKLSEILINMKTVAEGIETCKVIHELKSENKIEMPICEEVYQVLFCDKDPQKSILDIMHRQLREEKDYQIVE